MKIGGQRTIVDLFLENAGRTPDQSFIRFEGEEFTFGEMGRASGQVAETLVEAGVGHQSRVALAMGNRPAFLAAFLGILRCGATAIPLNTLYKPDEVRYALEHAQCQAVVTEETLGTTVNEACRLAAQDIVVLLADTGDETRFGLLSDRARAEPPDKSPARPGPGDLAGIFYTSGTTARPKGVMISHENMMYSAEVTIKSLGLGANDVPLLAFPLFHVNSLFYGVLTAIVLQGTIGLLGGFSVSAYWADAVRSGATWTPGITGPLVQLLLDKESGHSKTASAWRWCPGGA